MLDTLTYPQVHGDKTTPLITVYAHSTCGFCKRAMTYLEKNKYAYRFIYMDAIPIEIKNEAKRTLKEKFKVDIAFPFATIGDSDPLVGFMEADWKRTLGL